MKSNIKFCISSTLFKILLDKNINDITISEIASNANISRSSFYNNFNNLNEVIDYTIDNIINDIFNIYYINRVRKKDFFNFYLLLLDYIIEKKCYFISIRKYFFDNFKNKLDNVFISSICNNYDYFIKSSCIINIVFLYFDNKLNKNDLINIFKLIK